VPVRIFPKEIGVWAGMPLTKRDISRDLANLDVALSILEFNVKNVYAQVWNADLTAEQSIHLDTDGRTILEIYASSSAATTFRMDVSADYIDWVTDYYVWTNVTEVKEVHQNGFRYVRLKSDPAGVTGDTVTLLLASGR